MINPYTILTDDEAKQGVKDYKNELIKALSNQFSSLPMILNPIYKIPPSTGKGIAVSIGGTNGYVSLFKISPKGGVTFYNREIFSIPPKIIKNDLFSLITREIAKVKKGVKDALPIGIGLAYPLKPILHAGFIDGILESMSKGRDIDGLVGKKVGQEYHRYLIDHHGIDTTVAVANDAICLLLGAQGVEIAGVVGTGLNIAYWEKRSKIAPLKLSDLPGFSDREVAINTESANFNRLPINESISTLDKESANPGKAIAEKQVSGAYLFKLFNIVSKSIVSPKCPDVLSTDELNEVQTGKWSKNSSLSLDERKLVRSLAQTIFKRSAQVVAIELAGTLSKLGKTEGLVSIVMEGGVFWRAEGYMTLVNAFLHDLLPEVIPSFARLFGSSRRGIAILARSPFI